MFSPNKDIKKILKNASKEGWSFSKGRSGHIKGRHLNGKTTTISCTPSKFIPIKVKKYLRVK